MVTAFRKPICYRSAVTSELLTLPLSYMGKKLMIIRMHAPWPVLLEECPVSSSCKHIHLGTVHWTGFYLTVCLYIPFLFFFCRVYLHNVNKAKTKMLHIQSINSFGNNNNSSLDFYSFCFGNGLKLIFIACCVYIYDTAYLQQMFSNNQRIQ